MKKSDLIEALSKDKRDTNKEGLGNCQSGL